MELGYRSLVKLSLIINLLEHRLKNPAKQARPSISTHMLSAEARKTGGGEPEAASSRRVSSCCLLVVGRRLGHSTGSRSLDMHAAIDVKDFTRRSRRIVAGHQ